ncbi:mitochondrial 37S ribosomal protein rsm10 [Microbotryomycetes sp. JL201]|nr:mitochondrial 37S ribosomal protein rsm10 [Microbotryomycetes sp. JL201]
MALSSRLHRAFSSLTARQSPASSSAAATASATADAVASTSAPRKTPPPATKSADAAAARRYDQYPPTSPFEHHVPIKPIHNVHVATLHLRAHTTELDKLTFFTSFALRAARALGLATSGAASLPIKTSLFTVPRSPFAHKKSQQNFWRKEHKRAIKVYDGNEQVVKAWLAFLRKEAMGGVGQKALVFEYKEVGWGQRMIQDQLRELEMGEEEGEVAETESEQQSLVAASGQHLDPQQVKDLAQGVVSELQQQIQDEEAIKAEQLEQAATEQRQEAEHAKEAREKEDAAKDPTAEANKS